jgi:carbon-monoxide dehydrogenase medium subunit
MKPAPFDYQRAHSVEHAVALLAQHAGTAKVLAGGQSLMPILAFRMASPSVLIDIGRVPGLNTITIDGDGVRLDALVRWCDIERDERLANAHPLLAAAIAHVAHFQVRNRGTVGGSLAHADPAAEMPGIAVACDGVIEIAGPNGLRSVAAKDFFVGVLSTALAEDEIIVALQLPAWPAARRWSFHEFARRRGDFAIAGVAVHFDRDAEGRALNPHIGMIGVADRPLRVEAAEKVLAGHAINAGTIAAACAAARENLSPPSDLHASAAYRAALAETLLERVLVEAASR